jgi:hypothetical protein
VVDVFLDELDKKAQKLVLPAIWGGIFNLIRTSEDRSTRGDRKLMEAFKSFIEGRNLREVHRNGPKFTWTNKQENPIQSNIDKSSSEYRMGAEISALLAEHPNQNRIRPLPFVVGH